MLASLNEMTVSQLEAVETQIATDLVAVRHALEAKKQETRARQDAEREKDANYQWQLREQERFRSMTEAQRELEVYRPGGPSSIRADGSAIWI